MRQERIVFGAGPVPGVPGKLFVVFVEPAKPNAGTFYADDPVRAMADVKAAYAGDRLIALPPLGMPPEAPLADASADVVISDLAELVGAKHYSHITNDEVMRRLCRAGLQFVRARAWELHGLLVAELTGASFTTAEVAVAAPTDEGVGFTLYPGRGAFARMAQSGAGELMIEGVMALRMEALPEWAAPSARAASGEAVIPVPARVSGGSRTSVGNEDAALLAAVAAAIAASGEGPAGAVRARVRAWVP